MHINAFFEGGGILGISFIGAYKALTDHGIYIDKALGISSGAIIASLIIARYSPNDLISLLNKYQDFAFLKPKTKIAMKNYIGKPLSLLIKKGIYDSLAIEKFVSNLLALKQIITFKDIAFGNNYNLKIVAYDFTAKRRLIFPDDLPSYGYDPKTFKIAKAIRMSCSIPFFYTPYELKVNNNIHYIIDGGVLKNVPTSLISNPKQLTFRFHINGIKSKLRRKLIIDNKEEDIENHLLINIPIDNKIKSTDFSISHDKIVYLFKQGYISCYKFLKKIGIT